MSQNKGAHPLGWPGSRQPEPMCGGSQFSLLLAHLVAQPWVRGDRNQTLKRPVYSLWDAATPIKFWVLILYMTLVGSLQGSWKQVYKMGDQLERIVTKEACDAVPWRVTQTVCQSFMT